MRYVFIMLLVTASLCFAQPSTTQETTVETTAPYVDENGTVFDEPFGKDTFMDQYEKLIWGFKSKLEESETAAVEFLTLQYKVLSKLGQGDESKTKILAAFDKRSDEFKFKDKDAARKLITDKIP